jgi:hypothetical protein
MGRGRAREDCGGSPGARVAHARSARASTVPRYSPPPPRPSGSRRFWACAASQAKKQRRRGLSPSFHSLFTMMREGLVAANAEITRSASRSGTMPNSSASAMNAGASATVRVAVFPISPPPLVRSSLFVVSTLRLIGVRLSSVSPGVFMLCCFVFIGRCAFEHLSTRRRLSFQSCRPHPADALWAELFTICL